MEKFNPRPATPGPTFRSRTLRLFAALAAIIVCATCGGGHDVVTAPEPVQPPPPDQPFTVTGPFNVLIGDSVKFDATLGTTLQSSVSWSTNNTTIATINSAGYAKGVAPGNVNIIGTVGGRTAEWKLTVSGKPAGSVQLSVTSLVLLEGDTARVTATVRDGSGKITNEYPVVWGTTDPSKASISETGLVTGNLRGGVSIAAFAGGKSASATVAIYTPPAEATAPDSVQIVVGTTRGWAVNTRQPDNLSWTGPVRDPRSDDTSVVRFNGSLIDARKVGRATISGYIGNLRVSTVVNVRAANMPVKILPQPADSVFAFINDSTAEVYALLHNANGVHLGDLAAGITYTSLDTAIFVRAGNSRLKGKQVGRGRLAVAYLTLIDTVIVNVLRKSLGEVRFVTRDSIILAPGAQASRGVRVDGRALPADSMQYLNWISSNPAVATVNASGTIQGVGPGRTTIYVRSGHTVDSLVTRVQTDRRPVVTAISPAVLLPGGTVTITGTNFRSTADSQTVKIGGQTGTILAASPTQLTVQVPSTGYPCQPTQQVTVSVTADGEPGFKLHPLRTALQVNLQKGESAQLTSQQLDCVETGGGSTARYVLSVINTAASSSNNLRLELSGTAPIANPQITPVMQLMTTQPRAAGPAPASRENPLNPERRKRAEAHERILKLNGEILRKNGRPEPFRRQGANGVSLALNVPQTVGELVTLRVPDISTSEACTKYSEVRARTVYNGQRVIMVEDIASPLAGTLNSTYATLGAEFDNVMFKLVGDYFGNPLAVHASGGVSKIVMLFSHKVNAAGPAAFVISCDFYPRTQLASSNENPIFYAYVPTVASSNFSSGTIGLWQHVIRGTMVHELKHIASLAEKISRGGTDSEESWLEEGTAMIASELWSRTIFGNTWRGEAKYAQTIYCEIRPTFSECQGKPYGVIDHMLYLSDFYFRINEASPLRWWSDGLYGSGWSFARWAADHYASTEQAFFKSITQATDVSGLANLSRATGRPVQELITDWIMATKMELEKRVAPPNSKWHIPSWDIREIYASLNADISGIIPNSGNPVKTFNVDYSGFRTNDLVVQGGTAAFYEIAPGGGAQSVLLKVWPTIGSSLPSTLQTVLVRVE